MFDLIIIFALVLLNGLLALSELAILSSRKNRLETLAGKGHKGAHAALRLHNDPGRFLSTVQAGITLVGIVAGFFGGATVAIHLEQGLAKIPVLASHAEALGKGLTVAGITYISIVFGELVPKRAALSHPERIAAAMAIPMTFVSFAASPVVWLLKVSMEGVLKILRLSGVRDTTVTEDEVKSLIDEGTRTGIFGPQEQEMIEGVLRLADRPVSLIMTPRTRIEWIDMNASTPEILESVDEHRFSRLLVCDEEVDQPLGVVHIKDLLPPALRGAPLRLKELTAPVLFVPGRMPVLKLLDLFKSEKQRMAVVIDEYGATDGLVTLTDVLETIAGDLPEPGEEEEPMIVQREDGSWLVDGMFPIDLIETHTGYTGLKKEKDIKTLAAFMLHHLKRLPVAGAAFDFENARFEVMDMDGHRIDKVLIQTTTRLEKPAEPKEET